jgi:hypothetical protein
LRAERGVREWREAFDCDSGKGGEERKGTEVDTVFSDDVKVEGMCPKENYSPRTTTGTRAP